MGTHIELHLTGAGHSGKGVRLRDLTEPQLSTILESASNDAGVDATALKLMRAEQKFGAQSCLVAVTAAPVTSLTDASIVWEPPDYDRAQLTTRDWELLKKVYARRHFASNDEVDAILGKAREVPAA